MNSSLSLSFELIYLMGWLLKNEKKMLNALVKHAIKKGLAHDLKEMNPSDLGDMSDKLYKVILDFLVYLEDSLAKNLDSVDLDSKTEDAILPAVKKLDYDHLDLKTIRLSMQQAKSQLSNNPDGPQENDVTFVEDAQKLLYEQILKNWAPNNNETLN